MDRERTSIKDKIMELCAEDDYGSWELWWAVEAENRPSKEGNLQHAFAKAVGDLIRERIIISKTRSADHKLSSTPFSIKRLHEEVRNSSQPDPERYYWFGLPAD
jgi:hypothetical protein